MSEQPRPSHSMLRDCGKASDNLIVVDDGTQTFIIECKDCLSSGAVRRVLEVKDGRRRSLMEDGAGEV